MYSRLDLVVRAHRVLTPAGEISASIGVRDGSIAVVDEPDASLDATRVVEVARDEVLMPGVVDSHVHFNDPGRTEWEGFASGTRAAAAGGVTTVVDMPLNSIPPTVDLPALEVKRTTARDRSFVDVGFWGGAIPGNGSELRRLHNAGVFGFKCFLLDSGVEEFPPLDARGLEETMRRVAAFAGLVIVHAEDADAIDDAPPAQGRSHQDFLRSRPSSAESAAVSRVVELARRTGCRVHILHVSSADTLPIIDSGRRNGVPVTAETCPHYLSFAAEDIAEGATQFKCCPPIRDRVNRELLWRGLAERKIDLVVSDHSPSTADLKCVDSGDFGLAWGGIASLQVSLPAVWTEARRRGHTLTDVARWMCHAPAQLSGLRGKGRIEVGYDADFCVFAPDEAFVVDSARLHHKNAVTPYAGQQLMGVVRQTWLRGVPVDVDAEPRGRLLSRGAT